MKKGYLIFAMVLLWTLLLSPGEPAQAVDGAEGGAVAAADSVSAAPGSTAEVALRITGNPGILGAVFEISYPAGLTLTGVRRGEAFQALTMTSPPNFSSPCRFVWDGAEIGPEDGGDGVFLTLIFMVSETAQPGDVFAVAISCESKNTIDQNLRPVAVETVGGAVRVEGGSEGLIAYATGAVRNRSIRLTFSSRSAYSDAVLITAGYEQTGKQIWAMSQTVDLDAGENWFQMDAESAASTYRTYLLDRQLRPLCPAILSLET